MYKKNPFFLRNPEALTLILYSDAVEVVNPLGAGRGKHKVVQIFLTLGDIPKNQRSKIDRIMLVAVFREKILKRYGLHKVYEPIVKDLQELEKGIIVYKPFERIIRGGLLMYPADNLESHAIGGFSQSFSSRDICRYCHIQYDDLQSNIHSYGPKQHTEWTISEYDHVSRIAEQKGLSNICESGNLSLSDSDDNDSEGDICDDDDTELHGVKGRCPLNRLEAFHCTRGLPVDLMHDIFEGVVSQDLLGVLRILKSKGWFSMQEYNRNLDSFKFKDNDRNDRPQSVPESAGAKKLVGKAMSIWSHIRNFPLLIRNFVKDKNEAVLRFGLLLHELVERITAPQFKSYEVDVLEEKIIEYLDHRQLLFEEYGSLLGSAKPKMHFMTHYPECVIKFGPPINYWTARFESRHRIAKSCAESGKFFRIAVELPLKYDHFKCVDGISLNISYVSNL